MRAAQAVGFTSRASPLRWRSICYAAPDCRGVRQSSLDFDIEAIGFELPEIDFRIQSLDSTEAADTADEFDVSVGPAVSRLGDLWLLGNHLGINAGNLGIETQFDACLVVEAVRTQRNPVLGGAAGKIVLGQVRPIDRCRGVTAQHNDAAAKSPPPKHLLGRCQGRQDQHCGGL